MIRRPIERVLERPLEDLGAEVSASTTYVNPRPDGAPSAPGRVAPLGSHHSPQPRARLLPFALVALVAMCVLLTLWLRSLHWDSSPILGVALKVIAYLAGLLVGVPVVSVFLFRVSRGIFRLWQLFLFGPETPEGEVPQPASRG